MSNARTPLTPSEAQRCSHRGVDGRRMVAPTLSVCPVCIHATIRAMIEEGHPEMLAMSTRLDAR